MKDVCDNAVCDNIKSIKNASCAICLQRHFCAVRLLEVCNILLQMLTFLHQPPPFHFLTTSASTTKQCVLMNCSTQFTIFFILFVAISTLKRQTISSCYKAICTYICKLICSGRYGMRLFALLCVRSISITKLVWLAILSSVQLTHSLAPFNFQ